MPWRETCIMDERMCFVASCIAGDESVSALCRHFGISRKTGHKWLARYRSDGTVGLFAIADDVWLVKYGPLVLGTMKGRLGFVRIGPGRPSRPDPDRNAT